MTLDELRQWFQDLEIDGSVELNVIFYGVTLYIEGLGRNVKEDSDNRYETKQVHLNNQTNKQGENKWETVQ